MKATIGMKVQGYTYWKTTSDGRELYRSEGRLYGIITL